MTDPRESPREAIARWLHATRPWRGRGWDFLPAGRRLAYFLEADELLALVGPAQPREAPLSAETFGSPQSAQSVESRPLPSEAQAADAAELDRLLEEVWRAGNDARFAKARAAIHRFVFSGSSEAQRDTERDAPEWEMRVREWLWLSHGVRVGHENIGPLYGDDGEMSCGACIIDFRRWSLNDIVERLDQRRLAAMAPSAPPEQEKPT